MIAASRSGVSENYTNNTPIAAPRPRALSAARGWRGGFANLVCKEHSL